MIDFDYVRANDVSDAIRKIAADSTANSSPAVPISSI